MKRGGYNIPGRGRSAACDAGAKRATPTRKIHHMTSATDLMTIGEQLVALCREQKYGEAIDTLYADDVVTAEPCDEQLNGIEAVRQKNDWWADNFEQHTNDVQGPWPHGDRFAVRFQTQVTHRPSGEKMTLDEIGLYTVKDNKIVRVEFFYSESA